MRALWHFIRVVGVPVEKRWHGPPPRGLMERMDTDSLVLDHLELVDRCARRFRGWGEPHDDLVQAGRLGLLQAARRYDAARGVPFAAYAVPLVLGAIRHHLRDHGAVLRGPRGGRRPVVDELDDGSTLAAGPPAAYDLVELRLALLPALDLLPAQERDVLALRFLAGLTQDSVAERVGISQAQVSRVQARALARLRRGLGSATWSAA